MKSLYVLWKTNALRTVHVFSYVQWDARFCVHEDFGTGFCHFWVGRGREVSILGSFPILEFATGQFHVEAAGPTS